MTTPTIARKCHWLRRNRSSRRPEWLLFVDAESHLTATGNLADLHTFRLGWAALCHYTPAKGLVTLGWYKITDLLDFWRTVTSTAEGRDNLYVVSHNIDYDSRVLHAFSILPGLGYAPRYCIIADSCRFFSFGDKETKINLLDNLNYWPMPLAELGIEFGIPKLEIDFAACTDDELSVYCKKDVEILTRVWRYWLSFLDEHDLGDWSITTAGQSWNAYRHKFMPCKIGIHNRADAIHLERASYKGGRCEVWRIGKFLNGPFYKLDVNGLYAHCMRAYKSPQKLVKVLTNITPQELSRLLDRYMVIADVLVETDQPVYPVVLEGYNVFPVGSFRTCLTTFDLQYALPRGHITGIGQVAIYEPQYLFKPFIDYFTPLRQQYKDQGDTGRSLLCKLIRNSLYGKFGQKGYEQETIGDAPLDAVNVTRWIDSETGQKCVDWTFGGKVIRQYYTEEGFDSFPAIASHVASAGRWILWDYAQKASLENVYYADTDSLIVNQVGYDALQPWIDPVALGYLKREGSSPDLHVTAKKSYVFGSERTIKGIRKNAQEVSPGRWRQTHFTSLKWAFAKGNLDDVLTYEVEKEEHPTLFHGRLGSDHQVLPPEIALDADQVSAIVAPDSQVVWDWWIHPRWIAALETREHLPEIPLSFELEPPGLEGYETIL
jgi:hypothetical protein